MKIAYINPPLESKKGIPLLTQNRQFQWFHSPTYIYPVVPAYAVTMLHRKGHQVYWCDGVAKKQKYFQWLKELKIISPDLVFLESKTPVIKQHWKIINKIKTILPNTKICLVGDHPTALPKESFYFSKVDYVLTGGDYDFLLVNLVTHLTNNKSLEPGIWFRQERKILNSGQFILNHNLNKLPLLNRKLSQWSLYAINNGNFKSKPGTYIMSGRDCWWRKNGGCAFCSWTTLYPQFRIRSVKKVLSEIESLLKLGIKEIMDDTGSFPTGKWLHAFCQGMSNNDSKINFNCNLRFGILAKKDYRKVAQAGFRLLLFGLEFANQKTLNLLGKGIEIKRIEKELQIIKEVNQQFNGQLQPHLTFMIGYPWETKEEAQKTIDFAHLLFSKKLIDSLQATLIIPYPGTKLFKQAKKNKWLKSINWQDYDMKKSVLKTCLSNNEQLQMIRKLYLSCLTPKFIFSKLFMIKNINDLINLFNQSIKWLGHLWDFQKKS